MHFILQYKFYLYLCSVKTNNKQRKIHKAMKTAEEYKAKLIELQNEQRILMQGNMRLKANRIRKQQINIEFDAVKREWREKLGVTMGFSK